MICIFFFIQKVNSSKSILKWGNKKQENLLSAVLQRKRIVQESRQFHVERDPDTPQWKSSSHRQGGTDQERLFRQAGQRRHGGSRTSVKRWRGRDRPVGAAHRLSKPQI